MLNIKKLTRTSLVWAELSMANGDMVPDKASKPIAISGHEEFVPYRIKGDSKRLFGRVQRQNGRVEWYEVLTETTAS